MGILSQVSTQDKHVKLQAKTFLAGDLGLGMGALLPYACAALGGLCNLTTQEPEIVSSLIFAFAGAFLLLWTWHAFPVTLYRLPYSVRFPQAPKAILEQGHLLTIEEGSGQSDIESNTDVAPVGHCATESDFKSRAMLLVSGSLRVFVQSAALMAIAVYMHDVGYMGYFRQSCAVAILCLIPVPFEGFASGVWLQETFPSLHKYGKRISS